MASQKKAAKPAAKKPALKKAAPSKPVKKAVPAKKQVKSAPKKGAKPLAKKPAPKPVAKKTSKPVAKKPATKSVVKKAVKAIPQAAAKKASKPVSKQRAKKIVAPVKISKKVVTPIVKNPVTTSKHTPQPMTKKVEDKKQVTKPVVAGAKATAKNPKDIKIVPAKPVNIPKINTKTSRKYQPDFTKSVLDQPKNDSGAMMIRYSDTDLAEFRELIQRKLVAAKKELSYLQGLITRKDELGGDESENRYMTMEDGSLSMEREQLSQMASRQITFIDHLEKAIMRIENKTYGICRITGKLIDKARLRAVPHATLSMEAKMGQR